MSERLDHGVFYKLCGRVNVRQTGGAPLQKPEIWSLKSEKWLRTLSVQGSTLLAVCGVCQQVLTLMKYST